MSTTAAVTPSVPHRSPNGEHPADIVEPDTWWWDGAMRALEAVAADQLIITADTLRDDPFSLPEPRHPSQWGALFRTAHAAGLIKPVGYAVSTTPSRHRGVLRTWRGIRYEFVVGRGLEPVELEVRS